MAHVTFIHGIANKVAEGPLLKAWLDALRDNDGPDLGSKDVTTSMCYWADVLYGKPLSEATAGAEAAGEDAELAGAEYLGMAWFRALSQPEQAQIRELAAEVGAVTWLAESTLSEGELAEADPDDDEVDADPESSGSPTEPGEPAEANIDFERVPLPGPLKRRLMKAFLRDVHHYLWDTAHEPRPGELYHVRAEVRRRALKSMLAAGNSRPHVVVGHSLGSVIAYDVLQNVGGAPQVDGLLTLGSPLGLDEVQDQLKPGWSRWNGFPSERMRGGWTNVFDRLDPVCGFDPVLANDFRRGGSSVVTDIEEANWGRWRHSVGKYLSKPLLRRALVDLLDLR
jgi:hypothetical protein